VKSDYRPCAAEAERNDLTQLGRLVEPFVKEIRSPLGNLIAAAEILSEATGSDDPSSGFIRLVYQESERIQKTISDLTTLALPPEIKPRAIDLIPLLDDVLRTIESAATRQGIRLCAEFPPHSLYVWADPDALRAALDKFPQHAVDSMPFGGTLPRCTGPRALENIRTVRGNRRSQAGNGPGAVQDDRRAHGRKRGGPGRRSGPRDRDSSGPAVGRAAECKTVSRES